MNTLVVVAGLPASGKSYFARALARTTGAWHLASDAVRLDLTDGHPTYSPSESFATHASVRRLAAAHLADGGSAIVDATGIVSRDRRAAIDIGRAAGVRTVLVWCTADEATATERFAHRAAKADPLDSSEADASIRARMAARASRPGSHEADQVFYLSPDSFDATLAEVTGACA